MVEDFYPMLIKLANNLQKNEKSPIKSIVSSSLMSCFIVYFKWLIKKNRWSLHKDSNYSFKKILIIYNQLSDLYGDRFIHQMSSFDLNHSNIPIGNDEKSEADYLSSNVKRKFRQIEKVASNVAGSFELA